MESESLTGLPVSRPYELRSRTPDFELAFPILDEHALDRTRQSIAKHLRGSEVLMLHDLAVPAAATSIDHLCIGPNGITAIDVERARDDESRENLVRRITRETEVLAAVLTEVGIGSYQIHGAICQAGRRFPGRSSALHGVTFGAPRRVAKIARANRGGRPLDVQLALAVVRNRLGHEGQRSYSITHPRAL